MHLCISKSEFGPISLVIGFTVLLQETVRYCSTLLSHGRKAINCQI